MAKRTIQLLGQPHYNEEGSATEAILPGLLVKGVTSIAKQTANGAYVPFAVALEREELGKDIDDSYAIGDTVKVGVFNAGDHVNCLIDSGENIAIDGLLEADNNGTLKARASGVAIARALEARNNTTGSLGLQARIRVEVI